MAKKIFYSLSRLDDGIQYIKREGSDVPNDFGLDLAVYKAVDVNSKDCGKDGKIWHVVDTYCGLSVGSGPTKRAAIEKAFARLAKADMELYRYKVKQTLETFGSPPNHKIYYL